MPGRLLDRLTLGPWRRRRHLMRQLRELDYLDAGLPVAHPTYRRGWRLRILTVVTALGLAAVVFQVIGPRFGYSLTFDGIKHVERLAPEVRADTTGGSWDYMMRQPDNPEEPVRYNPCKPIRYELNVDLAPPGGDEVVFAAIEEIEAHTGLRFAFEGYTGEIPTGSRGPQARNFLGKYPPALIAWTTSKVVGELAGDTAGLGGSSATSAPGGGELVYVTGEITLDAVALASSMETPEGTSLVKAIVLHELGHLVGLGHVTDPGELMFSDNVGRTDFGPGDLQGLAILGQGKCYG